MARLRAVLVAGALGLVLSSCTSLSPRDELRLELIQCGAIASLGTTGKRDAPETQLGYVHEVDANAIPRFVQSCDGIDAAPGTRFGLLVRVLGDPRAPSIPVTTRVTHPEMRDPSTGRASTVDQWDWQLDTRFPRYTGWRFEHPWELVEGTWRIEILHGGRAVLTRDVSVRKRR
jgi:hypothetical protein